MSNEISLYDTHAHFNLNPGESAAVMVRAFESGVNRLVAVGGNQDLNAGAMAVAEVYPDNVRLALGFDRSQAKNFETSVCIDILRDLNQRKTVAAVGETGLDFHYEAESSVAQCRLFAAQLELADEWGKPVIIHTREADEATLRVLDETPFSGNALRGVVHCFTGTRAFAKELLDRNLAISFSGIVTFKNADMLRESALYVPAERLMIETDSPYLAPVPMRGNRNEPAFVKYVAECLGQLRGMAWEDIAELTSRNAIAMFG